MVATPTSGFPKVWYAETQQPSAPDSAASCLKELRVAHLGAQNQRRDINLANSL
jgi:hypothetical protein